MPWTAQALVGAKEILRVPAEGPPFYLGLHIGDTDLGLVVKEDPGTGAATVARVKALGGSVRGGPNDMPWGQRVAHIKDPDDNPMHLHSADCGRLRLFRPRAGPGALGPRSRGGRPAQPLRSIPQQRLARL